MKKITENSEWMNLIADVEKTDGEIAAKLEADAALEAAYGNPEGFWVVKNGGDAALFRARLAEARVAAKQWCEVVQADAVEINICTLDKEHDELVIVAKYRREWHEVEAAEVITPCHFGAIYNASSIIG